MASLVEILKNICNNLSVSDEIKSAAFLLASSFPKSVEVLPTTPTSKALCILYAAIIEKRFVSGKDNFATLLTSAEACLSDDALPTIALGDLLQFGGINIRDFFEHMDAMDEVQCWSKSVSQHLSYVKKQYCLSALMFSKLSRITQQLHSAGLLTQISSNQEIELKRLTWILFLQLRDRLGSADIFNCLSVLLSCFCLSACCHEVAPNATLCTTVLHYLGDSYKCRAELVAMYATVQEVVKELPRVNGCLDTNVLVADYECNYKRLCSINELLMLRDDPTLIVATLHRKEYKESSPEPSTDSSQRSSVCLTPVSKRLVGAMGYQAIGETADSSIIIDNFFQHQASDPHVELRKYLMTLRSGFVEAYVSSNGQLMRQIAEHRFQLISRLYFSVLESICLQHKNTMTQDEVTVIFNDSSFHSGLVACATLSLMLVFNQCSEDDLLSIEQISSQLNWVLSAYNLGVAEVFKLLSLFMTSAVPITDDMQKQLQRIENYILTTVAWHEDSSLWHLYEDHMVTNVSSSSDAAQCVALATNGASSASTAQMAGLNSVSRSPAGFLSPIKRCPVLPSFSNCQSPVKSFTGLQSPCKSATLTPNGRVSAAALGRAGAAAPTSPAASSIVKLFCSTEKKGNTVNYLIAKVTWIAHIRIAQLTAKLDIKNDDFMQKVKKTIDYCIMFHGDLLKNRHLDQIVMCVVYGLGKVTELEAMGGQEMTFRSIIHAYRQIPHDSDEVYKRVQMSPGIYNCIITFYNQVFVSAIKDFLMQFTQSKSTAVTEESKTMPPSSPLKSPSFVLRGCPNITISPMKQSLELMTPRSRKFYCFGTPGSSEKLKSINESIRIAAGNTPKQVSSSKRTFADNAQQLPLRDIDPSSTSRKQLKFDFANGVH